MKKASYFIIVCLLFSLLIIGRTSVSANDTLVTYDDIPGRNPSTEFTVTVNSTTVKAYDYLFNSDFTRFSFSGTATVSVTYYTAFDDYTLGPKRLNMSSSKSGNTVTFSLTEKRQYYLKIGSKYLYIFADPIETDVPDPQDTNVLDLVADYQVDNTGNTVQTEKVQNAINAASAIEGGGCVYFPDGTYKTETLFLKSNVRLYLSDGAVLKQTGQMLRGDFMRAVDESNISVTGRGVIDNRGQETIAYHDLESSNAPQIVRCITFIDCSNIKIEGIIQLDANWWTNNIRCCDNVEIEYVKVINSDVNCVDGFDILSTQYATVENCFYRGGDDPFVVKSKTVSGYGYPRTENAQYVTFLNCLGYQVNHSYSIAGLKIGDETSTEFIKDIKFEGCDMINARRGIAIMNGSIYTMNEGGGLIQNVIFKNCGIENAPQNMYFYINSAGTYNNSAINDVLVDNCVFYNNRTSTFNGYNSSHKIDGVEFSNLVIEGSMKTSLTEANITTNGYVNNVTFHTPTPWVTGQVNNALAFDGIDDYVDVDDDNSLDMGTGNFAITLWFKRNENDAVNLRLISKGCATDSDQ